jgi:nucleoside 2-deoxyribosyltransferase
MGIKEISKKILEKFKKQSLKQFITTNIHLQIRIGVTGHRDIKLTDELKSCIHTALTESIQKIINPKLKKLITPITYKIVTPLADGADRFVAKEAMQVLNAEMEVVLPMIKEEYEQTFLTTHSINEFENLLTKASRVNTLISKPLLEQFPGAIIDECRHLAYEKNSKFIVDNCDILIAIWNGKKSEGNGGTYATLAYALKKKKTIIIILSKPPHKISFKRGNDFLRTSFDRCELFNNYKVTAVEEQTYIDNVSKDLFANTEGILNHANINLVKENLIPFYVRASKIAKKYQSLYQKTGLIAYVFSTLAVSDVALGILIHHLSWLFFLTEFLLLLTILFIILFTDRCKAHKKWIQYRFLTEQIRIAIFFIVCGFKPTQIKIPSYFRVAHRPDDWMAKVHDEILRRLPDIPPYKSDDYKVLLEYIKMRWIQEQFIYHKKTSASSGKMNKYLELFGGLVFALALIAAAVHTILLITGFEFQHRWTSDYIIFAAISLPALGASLGAIRNHREYSRIEKRSENMVTLLEELLKESENVKSMNDLKNLLDNIEEAILHESQDWLMLMKFVKLETI